MHPALVPESNPPASAEPPSGTSLHVTRFEASEVTLASEMTVEVASSTTWTVTTPSETAHPSCEHGPGAGEPQSTRHAQAASKKPRPRVRMRSTRAHEVPGRLAGETPAIWGRSHD